MTRLSLAIILIFCSFSTFGQILEPASWTYEASKAEVQIGDEIELIFKVKLEDTWHPYSADLDPEIGPLPTVFEFKKDPSYELIGDIVQKGIHKEYDSLC